MRAFVYNATCKFSQCVKSSMDCHRCGHYSYAALAVAANNFADGGVSLDPPSKPKDPSVFPLLLQRLALSAGRSPAKVETGD